MFDGISKLQRKGVYAGMTFAESDDTKLQHVSSDTATWDLSIELLRTVGDFNPRATG